MGSEKITFTEFIPISLELDRSGLVWHPEIGDEVTQRADLARVSILVDPRGMTPGELRSTFVWLPTVEQIVQQLEARQAMIYHAGINPTLAYETVVRTSYGVIETTAKSLRAAFAKALRDLLVNNATEIVH